MLAIVYEQVAADDISVFGMPFDDLPVVILVHIGECEAVCTRYLFADLQIYVMEIPFAHAEEIAFVSVCPHHGGVLRIAFPSQVVPFLLQSPYV